MKIKKGKIKKIRNITLTLVGIIIVLFIIYIFAFIIFRPFNGMITEGRPILKEICEMQKECNSDLASIKCGIEGEEFTKERLWKAKSYHGCNESTNSYYQSGKSYYVKIEICSCGGLM